MNPSSSKRTETDLDVAEMSIFETSWRKRNLSGNALPILVTALFIFIFLFKMRAMEIQAHQLIFDLHKNIGTNNYPADNNNHQ